MFHRFSNSISDIALPQKFTCPFCYTPHSLCVMAAKEVETYVLARDAEFQVSCDGKMFGVLVVENEQQEIGFVAAFSGLLAEKNVHEYFVPPVFDILADRTFFLDEEAEISAINREIEAIEHDGEYTARKLRIAQAKAAKADRLSAMKAAMQTAKRERDNLRLQQPSKEVLSELIRESQFQKAEYKRLEHSLHETIKMLEQDCLEYEQHIETLKQTRAKKSAELQKKLFSGFLFRNANGGTENLLNIFVKAGRGVPPAGSGECAGPRLLQYAYTQHLRPIAMAEFWLGASPKQEIRESGNYYPACKQKCEPILSYMLQGLEVEENPLLKNNAQGMVTVVYEDDVLLVIDKPSGMLSVRGKNSLPTAYDWARNHCGVEVFMVHRLDMETSGLLVIAKNEAVQKTLQQQFSERTVQKRYVAILDGEISQHSGTISLPLRPDITDRPRQLVDFEYGKPSVTEFLVLEKHDGKTRIAFFPKTGRTHQLRVHAAHKQGLACPIIGDNLYGKSADRLYLHAQKIVFTHPVTQVVVTCESPVPF